MKKILRVITGFVFLVLMLSSLSCSSPPIETSLLYHGQINTIVPFEKGFTTKAVVITPNGNINLSSCSIYLLQEGSITLIAETRGVVIDGWVIEITEAINGEYWLYQQEHSSMKYILSEKRILNWSKE